MTRQIVLLCFIFPFPLSKNSVLVFVLFHYAFPSLLVMHFHFREHFPFTHSKRTSTHNTLFNHSSLPHNASPTHTSNSLSLNTLRLLLRNAVDIASA